MNDKKKQTAVDYLLEYCERENWSIPNNIIEQAKEMEKEVAQQYAEFAIECDRKELPVLEFDGWINL